MPCSSSRACSGAAASQSGLACVLATPSHRCWHAAPHSRPAGQRSAVPTPAAMQRHVANSAALVERTLELDAEDSMLLSAENERRRRSLEQSWRGAEAEEPEEARSQQVPACSTLRLCASQSAFNDIFDVYYGLADMPQPLLASSRPLTVGISMVISQDQASPSQRLEVSWQSPADNAAPSTSTRTSTSSRSERPSAQPAGRRQPKRRRSTAAAAAAASTTTIERPAQTAAADEADRSDQQLLNGALKQLNGRSAASRRAARRTTGQGRVGTAENAGVVRPVDKQQPEKLGPAETFLRALQERLYKSRSAK